MTLVSACRGAAANLRLYYPDFAAVDTDATHWLIETKGAEDVNVRLKDQAAELWCSHASQLGGTQWRYAKVRQQEFDSIQPERLSDLSNMGQQRSTM